MKKGISKKKSLAGRKSKYHTHVQPYLDVIKGWCRMGMTDKEMCKRLDVSQESFYKYQKKYLEFVESVKYNKDMADTIIVNSLYKRAKGFETTEIQELADGNTRIVTKEIPPDTTAMIYWLKNRQPQFWRDRQEVDIRSVQMNIDVNIQEKNQLLEHLGELRQIDDRREDNV